MSIFKVAGPVVFVYSFFSVRFVSFRSSDLLYRIEVLGIRRSKQNAGWQSRAEKFIAKGIDRMLTVRNRLTKVIVSGRNKLFSAMFL